MQSSVHMNKKATNNLWIHLDPIKDRKVSKKSLDNLITEKPKWNNLPTKVIRIQKVFSDKLIKVAQIWDREDSIDRDTDYSNKDIEQAISILKKSLKLPANRGGAIKQEIREAIRLLQAEGQH